MKAEGIRIKDKKNENSCIDLLDILTEVKNENTYNWSILYMYIMGNLGEGKSVPKLEDQISLSKNGLLISWRDLLDMASHFKEVIDITILGCKDIKAIVRYDDDQDMYETCDIVIEMIDSSYWEVFSKDSEFINRLKNKFKDTQLLETDFLKN